MNTGIDWIDPHCHLNLMEMPEEAIQRAHAAGVSQMVVIGIDGALSRKALDISQSSEGVWAAVGIHPNESTGWNDETLAEVKELAARPEAVAIGEIGLDFYRQHASHDDQYRAFEAQLTLADELDLAVVIHTRESQDQVLDVLKVNTPKRFVLHCFTGTSEQLDRAVQLGAYVSFAGNVSYPKAEDLRDRARAVPAERLLVETDSPFLAPQAVRGKPNEPGYLPMVGQAVAEARGVPVEEIASTTSQNARRLFGLDQR